MSVFRIFNYILVKLSSMIMFNSDLIQTMIHFLFAIAILLLLSMTRHPASVFTARFQDCEFVYHVLAQVVTMLHLTHIIRPYKFVTFTKFVLTYNLYGYLWANTVRPTDYTLLLLYKKLCV